MTSIKIPRDRKVVLVRDPRNFLYEPWFYIVVVAGSFLNYFSKPIIIPEVYIAY